MRVSVFNATIIVVTLAIFSLVTFGFWLSYPVWFDGLKPPKYDFLVSLLGNALVSVFDVMIVTLFVGYIITRREESRWRRSRLRFDNKLRAEVLYLCAFYVDYSVDRYSNWAMDKFLGEDIAGMMKSIFNFSWNTRNDAMARCKGFDSFVEHLLDIYSPALDADCYSFVDELTDLITKIGNYARQIDADVSTNHDKDFKYPLSVVAISQTLIARLRDVVDLYDHRRPNIIRFGPKGIDPQFIRKIEIAELFLKDLKLERPNYSLQHRAEMRNFRDRYAGKDEYNIQNFHPGRKDDIFSGTMNAD